MSWADDVTGINGQEIDLYGRNIQKPTDTYELPSNVTDQNSLAMSCKLDTKSLSFACKNNNQIPFGPKFIICPDDYLYMLPWIPGWVYFRGPAFLYGQKRLNDKLFVKNNPELAGWLSNKKNKKTTSRKQQFKYQQIFTARINIIAHSRKNKNISRTAPLPPINIAKQNNNQYKHYPMQRPQYVLNPMMTPVNHRINQSMVRNMGIDYHPSMMRQQMGRIVRLNSFNQMPVINPNHPPHNTNRNPNHGNQNTIPE